MQRAPLDLAQFSPNLRKHVDPKAPPPLRLMAAKGLLPMAPEELVCVLYQLSFDADAAVKKVAVETIDTTPADLLGNALAKPLPPPVLDWLAQRRARDTTIQQGVVTNPEVDDRTVERIALKADADTCDLIAENQVRLLAAPNIIEALYLNERARMSTVDKLVDLARRNGVLLDGIPAVRQYMESHAPVEVEGPLGDATADELFIKFLEESLEDEARLAKAAEEEEAPSRAISRQQYLSQLTVSQRIRFALLGGKQDRNHLIRDANRLVHLAAVSSPKNTDQDAIRWSANRSLPESVIQHIANNREWTRHYQIKLNLVNNPKTHLRTALRFLPFLFPRDLKQLSRNRNVPQQLARQAKALADKRGSGRGGHY